MTLIKICEYNKMQRITERIRQIADAEADRAGRELRENYPSATDDDVNRARSDAYWSSVRELASADIMFRRPQRITQVEPVNQPVIQVQGYTRPTRPISSVNPVEARANTGRTRIVDNALNRVARFMGLRDNRIRPAEVQLLDEGDIRVVLPENVSGAIEEATPLQDNYLYDEETDDSD